MFVLTKSVINTGRIVDPCTARRLLLGGRDAAMHRRSPGPLLVTYRARHEALAIIHRLWMRQGSVGESVLRAAWRSAWIRAEGEGEPDPVGLDWLYGYVADNPIFGSGSGRRIVAVEHRMRASFAGYEWQARPDVVIETADGTMLAFELTSARNPFIDPQAVRIMAALDQLVIAGPQAPLLLRARPHLVVICELRQYRETNITLPWDVVEATLEDISHWLTTLGDGVARRYRSVLPARHHLAPRRPRRMHHTPVWVRRASDRRAERQHAEGTTAQPSNSTVRSVHQSSPVARPG